MFDIPPAIQDRVERWAELKRWDRRELGQDLRRLGLSYREIMRLIPVAKGTLSHWCRNLELTDQQRERIANIRPRVEAQRRNGQRRHREALERWARIRSLARDEAQLFLHDPFWVAGVIAYWSEGDKRSRELKFANSDPDLTKLFIAWARRYLELDDDRFTVGLHLHSGQDEAERIDYWSEVTGLDRTHFRKTFIKPEGTGHRKNVLYNGTASIRVRRSGELSHRVLGWIDAVRDPHRLIG